MSIIRHKDSEKAGAMKLMGLGTVPPTQNTIATGGNQLYDTYPCREPISQLTAGQPITFLTTKSTMCTDLAESFIRVEGYCALKSDSFIGMTGQGATDVEVAPVPFFAAALLREIEIQINGTVVKQSQGQVDPYCTMTNMIINESFEDRETNDLTEGIFLNDPGTNDVDPDTNYGFYIRKQMYANGTAAGSSARLFSLVIRPSALGLDVRNWIPPNTDIRIAARLNGSGFLFHGGVSAISSVDPSLVITNADFYVARKELTPASHAALMAGWIQRPLTLPFQRIQSNVTYLDSSVSSFNVVGALGGMTPRTVVAYFVFQGAMTGDTGYQSFQLTPNNNTNTGVQFKNVRLTVGGSRIYPLKALNMQASGNQQGLATSTMDFAEAYQLYRQCADKDKPFLKSTDFTNILPLTFPIGSQLAGWDSGEDGTVQFEGNLNAAPGLPWAILLVSLTDSVIEIESTGRVLVA
jgi:hypothetical protein